MWWILTAQGILAATITVATVEFREIQFTTADVVPIKFPSLFFSPNVKNIIWTSDKHSMLNPKYVEY